MGQDSLPHWPDGLVDEQLQVLLLVLGAQTRGKGQSLRMLQQWQSHGGGEVGPQTSLVEGERYYFLYRKIRTIFYF